MLDFVGQAHRRYRIDRKLKALLPRHRYGIDKEVGAEPCRPDPRANPDLRERITAAADDRAGILEQGYTMLLFARDVKQRNNTTVPFTYLGPADLDRHETERPIKVVWRLHHPLPAEMFEMNLRGG